MQESNYYFYLWRHRIVTDDNQIVCRTCLGITGNPDNRTQGYEGHVGHVVKFARLWKGPKRLIQELEIRIKRDFYDYLFVGTRGFRYEWINESIDFESVVKWVEWEIQNTFIGIESAEIAQ
jgi:hypothetical protein